MNNAFRVTNIGAKYKNNSYLYGQCFMFTHVQLGGGGVDATGLPYAVDASRITLVKPITQQLAIETYATLSIPNPRKTTIVLNLASELAGTFSQLGIFGEVIYCNNPSDSALIGTRFLYCLCNFTEVAKSIGVAKSLTFSLNTAL